MADKYTVNLYDANGGFVGTADHNEDPNANRDRPINANGKVYTYQARQDRWVETGEPMEVKGKPKQPDQPPEVINSGMLHRGDSDR